MMRTKLPFLRYAQAPRGVILSGYILGGPARGTVPAAVLEKMQAMGDAAADARPD